MTGPVPVAGVAEPAAVLSTYQDLCFRRLETLRRLELLRRELRELGGKAHDLTNEELELGVLIDRLEREHPRLINRR